MAEFILVSHIVHNTAKNNAANLVRYTHVTTEMHRNAAAIVGDYLTKIFGEELKPWEENESREKEPSA